MTDHGGARGRRMIVAAKEIVQRYRRGDWVALGSTIDLLAWALAEVERLRAIADQIDPDDIKMPCTHPVSALVCGDGRSTYCGECEDEVG